MNAIKVKGPDRARRAPTSHRFAQAFRHVAVLAAAAASACVPSGNAPPYDGGTTANPLGSSYKPSINVMTAPFEDTFDRPDSGEESAAASDAAAFPLGLRDAKTDGGIQPRTSAAARAAGDAGTANDVALGQTGGGDAGRIGLLGALLREAGSTDRSNLGPNWIQIKTSAWKVEGGKLCGEGAHNHPVWLNRTLPVNARIEFEATAWSDEGDLKAEVWGDGVSYATGTSYTNASSYLTILGGWKNTLQVLARLNEHGKDRKEIAIDKDSDDPRQRPVQRGQTYRFRVERADGKTIRWFVDGVELFSWADAAPLAGQGHDHFGFNEWEARVCFDNVKVTPL